jgi:type II secretion system protein G
LYGKEEGFTLIELLVVVAIIALLATFAVPKLFDAINKSKRAPGQADMQTISGALERYYLDQSSTQYPAGTAAQVKTALTSNGYLKSGTSFYNGFQKGYIYMTDANGSFYVLADAQNTASTVNLTLRCGSANHEDTVHTADKDLSVVTATNITATDVKAGCLLGTGTGAGFAALPNNSDGTAGYSIVTY